MIDRLKAELERLVRENPEEAALRLAQLARRHLGHSEAWGVGYTYGTSEYRAVDELVAWLKELDRVGRCVAIVNAVIPPVELPAQLAIEPGTWADVERAVKAGVPHYVRHIGTAKLLGVPPHDGFYAPKRGDVYLVVRLKPGIAPRGTEVEAQVDDLEVLWVEVR